MRKYEIIWTRIKQRGNCSVQIDQRFQTRLIKAVVKEKYTDIVFKLENEDRRMSLIIERLSGVVKFTLKKSLSLADL